MTEQIDRARAFVRAQAKGRPDQLPPTATRLSQLMSEPPWSYVDQKVKDCAVFFTVVGVTYFLSSSVAFSLWVRFPTNLSGSTSLPSIQVCPAPSTVA